MENAELAESSACVPSIKHAAPAAVLIMITAALLRAMSYCRTRSGMKEAQLAWILLGCFARPVFIFLTGQVHRDAGERLFT